MRCARSWCSGIRTSFASSAAQNAGINGWDALKNKEKGRTTLADELGTVPVTLPALMRAQKLQKRADRCGAEQSAPETARRGLRQHWTAGTGTGRTGGGRTAVCCGQCHAAGWCGRGGSADLCIQALLCRTAGAERTKRYSGRVTCSDREKTNTKVTKSGGYFYDEDRSDRTGCCEH